MIKMPTIIEPSEFKLHTCELHRSQVASFLRAAREQRGSRALPHIGIFTHY